MSKNIYKMLNNKSIKQLDHMPVCYIHSLDAENQLMLLMIRMRMLQFGPGHRTFDLIDAMLPHDQYIGYLRTHSSSLL